MNHELMSGKGKVEDRLLGGHDYEAKVRFDEISSRIRVDDYRGNVVTMTKELEAFAKTDGYTKMIVRARHEHVAALLSRGYEMEGIYRGFYNGSDAFACTKYYSLDRRNSPFWLQENGILAEVLDLPAKWTKTELEAGYQLRKAIESDAPELAVLYGLTFPVYPTPLNEPEYVAKQIREGMLFQVIEHQGLIVSAAAAYINSELHHAEIADCATLPAYQKRGLMKILVDALEKELKAQRIYASFSHARALSFGMNATFHQLGYTYTGRLTQNCVIYDKLEDMSLWMKDLSV